MPNSTLPREVLDLNITASLPEPLVIEMIQLIEEFIPSMIPGHRYLLETMCGNAFWDKRLKPSQRTQAGSTMAKMVSGGLFDLNFAATYHGVTKMYQLK